MIGAPYLDDSIDKKDSPLYFGITEIREKFVLHLQFELLVLFIIYFIYLAITIAVRMIGPVFGYFLSSACLKLYIEISKKPSMKYRYFSFFSFVVLCATTFFRFLFYFTDWDSSDPRWIGAWWLGSLILAFLIAVFAIFVGSFPRNLGKQLKDKNKPSTTDDSNTHSTFEIAENLQSSSNQQKIKGLFFLN